MKRIHLLVILILASCTILAEQPSVLEDSRCDAPCWNEITVGETTKDEILAILKELPIVDQGSIAVVNSPWKIYDGSVNFFLYPSQIFKNHHRVYGQSNILEDKVIDIAFCGKPGVSFGDVVEKIGAPKNIIVLGSPSGGLFVIAINQDIGVQFWYDTKNVPKHLKAEIAPDIQIDCLVYFDPNLYQEKLEIGSFSMGHLNAEQTLKTMRPWTGYGNLDEKYPPRQP